MSIQACTAGTAPSVTDCGVVANDTDVANIGDVLLFKIRISCCSGTLASVTAIAGVLNSLAINATEISATVFIDLSPCDEWSW